MLRYQALNHITWRPLFFYDGLRDTQHSHGTACLILGQSRIEVCVIAKVCPGDKSAYEQTQTVTEIIFIIRHPMHCFILLSLKTPIRLWVCVQENSNAHVCSSDMNFGWPSNEHRASWRIVLHKADWNSIHPSIFLTWVKTGRHPGQVNHLIIL